MVVCGSNTDSQVVRVVLSILIYRLVPDFLDDHDFLASHLYHQDPGKVKDKL